MVRIGINGLILEYIYMRSQVQLEDFFYHLIAYFYYYLSDVFDLWVKCIYYVDMHNLTSVYNWNGVLRISGLKNCNY